MTDEFLELDVSIRTVNLLTQVAGYKAVAEVLKHTEAQLMSIPGFTWMHLREVRAALKQKGLALAGDPLQDPPTKSRPAFVVIAKTGESEMIAIGRYGHFRQAEGDAQALPAKFGAFVLPVLTMEKFLDEYDPTPE